MLAIRLSNEIEARLDSLAKQTGRTKTFYAREAILTHLEDLEDYYLSAETAARIRSGDEPVHSSEDMRKLLDLDD
ncbi:TraY domain-containing protein [Salmonella enterica]